MQIFIGSAKTMAVHSASNLYSTIPAFQSYANEIVKKMQTYTVEELGGMLGCSMDLASEAWKRYATFFDKNGLCPAAFCYDGIVFQKLNMRDFSVNELAYANEHLLIGSFLYGMLRPLDLIKPYRLEGNVVISEDANLTMFDYWKPILTDWFINKVKGDDGVLLNLASNEFRGILDWKRVGKEVEIVSPDFKVDKGGALKTITVYSKMCRGAMARYVLQNQIDDVEMLKAFAYEGFHWERDNLYVMD